MKLHETGEEAAKIKDKTVEKADLIPVKVIKQQKSG
jgi:hypothetical protein